LLKKLLIAIPVILILIIAGATVAYKFVGDDFIAAQALNQLEKILNRKVTIDGHFSLTRTARPTLTASNIRIASADWDPDNYLIKAADVTIQVDATPLLFGIISFDTIYFNQAVFNIIINKEGQSNLDLGENSNKSSRLSFYRPRISRMEMTDFVINYKNIEKNSRYDFHGSKLITKAIDEVNLDVTLNGVFNQQQFNLSGRMCRWMLLFGGEDCTINAQADIPPFKTKASGELSIRDEGYIDMSFDLTGENINDLKLPVKTYLPDTSSAEASFNLTGELKFIQLSGLKSNFIFDDSKASLSGSIQSINTFTGVQLQAYSEGTDGKWLNAYQDYFPGELIDHYTLSSEIENHNNGWKFSSIEASTKIDETTLFGKGEIIIDESPLYLNLSINGRGNHPEWIDRLQDDINAKYIDDVRVDFNLVGKENAWSIENLESTILTEDHTFTASGNIAFSADKTTQVELEISSAGRNLYSLARIIKYELPESKKFHIRSKLKYQDPTLSLSDTSIIVDNTNLTGQGEIDFVTPPNIRAQLKAKSLSVEHVIALSQDEAINPPVKKVSTNNETLFSDKPLELGWLNKADTDIDLQVDKITFRKAELDNLKTTLIASQGSAKFTIDSVSYSGSELTANLKTDIKSQTHEYYIHTENFNVGKLLKETDTTELLTGNLDFDLNIDSTGKTPRELAMNARGQFSAFITNGSLDNASVDLFATNLVKELLPGKKRDPRMEIECFFTHFKGEEGLFGSEVSLLNTKYIVMIASGDINLGKEKYDLRLIPKPKNTSLFTLDSDILVTGPLTEPKFTVSKGSVFKKILKGTSYIALGPAGLAIPFTTLGSSRYTECFEEVARKTTEAVNAQQEALQNKEVQKNDEEPAKPRVESLNP
jgi:uncharacterized protein involved in outer membrane biogenesis